MLIRGQERDILIFTDSGVTICCNYNAINSKFELHCLNLDSGVIIGQFDTKEEALRELKSIYIVYSNGGSFVTIDLLKEVE